MLKSFPFFLTFFYSPLPYYTRNVSLPLIKRISEARKGRV